MRKYSRYDDDYQENKFYKKEQRSLFFELSFSIAVAIIVVFLIIILK
jgi:hypothetical protein